MNEAGGDFRDSSGVLVRPPIAWALAVVAGLTLEWRYPLGFLPTAMPVGWLGSLVFVAGLALLILSAERGQTCGPAQPTTTVVTKGPYQYSRNPIYVSMSLGLIGLAIAFDSLWLIIVLLPFYLVIRYGVVAREEAYLERKFGDSDYRQRWSPQT